MLECRVIKRKRYDMAVVRISGTAGGGGGLNKMMASKMGQKGVKIVQKYLKK